MIGLLLIAALASLLSAGLFCILYIRQRLLVRELFGAFTDVHLKLEQSMISLMEDHNFGKLLRAVNTAVGTESALLAVFERNRLLDLQFTSTDNSVSFGLPRQEATEGRLSAEVIGLLEILRDTPVIHTRGECRSLFGALAARHCMTIGFREEERVFAVFQFVGRNRSFSRREHALVQSIRPALRAAALDYYNDLVKVEKRREAELALRRSEERYRSIFDDSMDLIYHAAGNGRILAINRAGVELLGYADETEIVGRDMGEFFFDSGQRDFYLELIAKNGYVKDMEIILERPDGEKLFCLESSSAAYDGTGGVRSFTGIIKDITSRIRLDRELWKANLELTQTNLKLQETQVQIVQSEKLASIGQLAAGIAHEINNPLGFVRSNYSAIQRYCDSLLGFAAAVREGAADPEELRRRFRIETIREDIDAVFRETGEGMERIMEIVQNLRSFSHSDRPGELSRLDFNEAVRNTLVIAKNEIKYYARVETNLGQLPEISCLAGEIKQVLLNIIVNAAQAIREQGSEEQGVIRVTTAAEDAHIRCVIEDSGPGIPDEMRHRVFDPFFTTKEVGQGTGMGLSISYDIVVNKHGGELSVGSSDLGGALFEIQLPLVARRSDAPGEQLEEL